MGFWHTMVEVFPRFMPVLLDGAVTAVEVAAGALVGGLLLARATLARMRAIRAGARAYIEIIRGTPALTQLFIIYFGLSDIGLELSPMAAAIIGLGAFTSTENLEERVDLAVRTIDAPALAHLRKTFN